ncbi:MAG: SCO family protein [Gemmatimonadetes bacterium]|nr:SCO family protein [Gemmatimonadota bacterium]
MIAATISRDFRFIVCALSMMAILPVLGCGGTGSEAPPARQNIVGTTPDHSHAGHAHRDELQAGEHSDYSIYHLGSTWWDQHGEQRSLASLAGRVQVVAMVYTHCSYTCPRILMDMKRIEAQIGETDPDGVGFVLISIDPERDDPERLAYFAQSTRLDPARWTLLSGPDSDILELATVLGIQYRREGVVDFAHSNSILILDEEGEIIFRQDGLGQDPGPIMAAMRTALR